MAHPLYWPGKYFFYPIGNTSAVCMTRDLAPEEHANILLLGCGDPRNVLYTIFCEPQKLGRALDFTCCDFDPAVLSRNVLLFTMVVDKQPHSTIWNIFFHIHLDKNSHLALVEQCKKLVGLSDSLQHWNASSYGSFLKMCTEFTLVELRRHWSLYAGMQDLPRKRIKALRDEFVQQGKLNLKGYGTFMGATRSAGPLMVQAIQITRDHFKNYWKTGTTFFDSKQVDAATMLNPTFVYSLGGEGSCVHYGTDPLSPFHLAAVFGNAKGSVSVTDVVKAAKAEFSSWCSALQTSVSSTVSRIPIIRFFLGNVIAVSRALQAYATTGTLKSGLPVAQWQTHLIQLSSDEYVVGGAPVNFNVIDTSNLDDHIGLLNLLIAAVPLLSMSSQNIVLYTESLLYRGPDATKEFAEHLYADITTVGILTGLCPVDYLSGFSTRSNTHELMAYSVLKGNVPQYHQVMTWKSPTSGDAIAAQDDGERRPLVFEPQQLGTFLYDMYHQMFEQEDSMHFWRLNQGNLRNAIAHSNLIHYMRESFALFLKLVRNRLGMSEEHWLEVMTRFDSLQLADQSLPMDTVNRHDLYTHLHLHGVYTVFMYRVNPPKIGRFTNWDTVPTVVRIIMVVPREKLSVLKGSVEEIGTPLLQGDVRGNWSHNVFTAVHVAFGRAIPMGTKARPWVSFEEDPQGWNGTSSLVVSFTVATRVLTDIEPPENLNICFSVRSTAGTAYLTRKLGLAMNLFSAKLMDESHIHVVPENPSPRTRAKAPSISTSNKPQSFPAVPTSGIAGALAQIGKSADVAVELDEQCELVVSLTSRVSIENEEVRRLFGSMTWSPQVKQMSPCVMRIMVGSYMQDIVYPFPAIGSKCKIRNARKSLYIEAVVPVSGPFQPDGMKLLPFPVISKERSSISAPWNVHRLNLSLLPILDINASQLDKWLNPHVESMMSSRERSLRKKHKTDTIMFLKDTIHTIFVRCSGIQQGPPKQLFVLTDEATNNCDTILFISDVKFDLSSHTIVCDGYVLCLTPALMPKIEKTLAKLVQEGDAVRVSVFEGEMIAWKQLLPALVERCRYSWQHSSNCEYNAQGKIPLTEEMEAEPLCSCGKGKDTEGMSKVSLWKKLSPYVTRVALSPLFAVSFLETVGRDPAAHKCFVCRGKGKPKLKACTACMKVRYCSKACQKSDWKVHKLRCKP